jgi:hypothetical protein
MRLPTIQYRHLLGVLASCLSCIFLLTACDLFGSSSPPATPAASPGSPTSTATAASTSPLNLATYTGDGYTIGYPKDWHVDTSQPGFVTFSDPQGIAYLSVHVQANPNGLVSTRDQVALGLALFKSRVTHYQRINMASTTTVGGESWTQGGATGDLTVKGQPAPVPAKVVVIADNHPANAPTTVGFTIAYATAQAVFDLAYEGEFQPMLQSFKFT